MVLKLVSTCRPELIILVILPPPVDSEQVVKLRFVVATAPRAVYLLDGLVRSERDFIRGDSDNRSVFRVKLMNIPGPVGT